MVPKNFASYVDILRLVVLWLYALLVSGLVFAIPVESLLKDLSIVVNMHVHPVQSITIFELDLLLETRLVIDFDKI